jgi:hypothetical protein
LEYYAELGLFGQYKKSHYEMLSKLRATFDVDLPADSKGDFLDYIEAVPQSKMRSMSVCWVVEAVPGDQSGSDSGTDSSTDGDTYKDPRIFEVKKIVRGMWKHQTMPFTTHTVI